MDTRAHARSRTHTPLFYLMLIWLKIYSHRTTTYCILTDLVSVSLLFYYTPSHIRIHRHANTHHESVWADAAYATPFRWSCRLPASHMFISNLCLCHTCSGHYITPFGGLVTLARLNCRWKSRKKI